jgi:hypothetical protein
MIKEEKILYLKPNIQAVPLIYNWYAWSYLIYPLTASYYLTKRMMPIMESFVEDPQIHIDANQSKSLMGGFFANLNFDNLPEILELIKHIKQNCSQLFALQKDLDYLSTLLLGCTNNESLEKLYTNVPETLKGLLEFNYDLYHNKLVTFFEHLVYKKYYSSKCQSILFAYIKSDYRPFVFSTPYLSSAQNVVINIPFESKILDEIITSQKTGIALPKITEIFNLPPHKLQIFAQFFSEEPTINLGNYIGNDLRVRYFGHACILLQTQNCNILIDPIISYPHDYHLKRFSLTDLPDSIDAVLITHNHQDHFNIETLLQIRHKTKLIIVMQNAVGEMADPSMQLILKHIGFKNVCTIRQFESMEIKDFNIIAIPFIGEHGDLAIKSKTSFLIKCVSQTFLFAADSNNLDATFYDYIFELYGTVANLFIGMECEGAPLSWLYGPLLQIPISRKSDQSRRLSGSNFPKALKLISSLKVCNVYVYAMGLEPWLSNIMGLKNQTDSPQVKEANLLVQYCLKSGISAEILYEKKEWIIPK